MTRSILSVALATALALATSAAIAQSPPIERADLAQGPYAKMEMLLEKTVLGVDVARVHVRFGQETADQLQALVEGQRYSDQLADRIAQVAAQADDAYVGIHFQRDASFDDFIASARQNLTLARQANMIDEQTYRQAWHTMPQMFAFLQQRGIKKGDWLVYRARPDSLRTAFVDAEGRELFDMTRPGNGRLILASYFAPGTDFREPLVRSLFERR